VTDLVYVYAILAEAPALLPRGIDGRTVRTVSDGHLLAAVGDVPEAEFGEAALNAGMADMHWLGPRAVAHQEVNQQLHEAASAVIPLAFGTVFRNDERVHAMLSGQQTELAARLERVKDRAEWVVAVHRTGAPGPTAAVDALQAEIDAASPGRAHLLKRRYAEVERDEARRQETDAVQHVLDALAAAADDVFVEPLPADAVERPLLRASVLVKRADEDRFVDTVAGLRTTWYDVLLTGPWPPYRFGGLEHAAATR
jgi:hypothetical protein